jgi:hypothetical protein
MKPRDRNREKSEPYLIPKSLDDLIRQELDSYKIPHSELGRVKDFILGKIPLSRLVCCQSGCAICEEDIYQIVRKLQKLDSLDQKRQ